MPQTVQPKSARKEFRKYIKVPTMTKPYVLGRDNTELSAELSWDETDELNVLGEMVSTNKLTAVAITVDPYYVRRDDELGMYLLDLYARRADLDDVKAIYYEAMIDEDGETIFANEQSCVILIQSIGGESTDAVAIPFNLKPTGSPVAVDYDFDTETFTPKV